MNAVDNMDAVDNRVDDYGQSADRHKNLFGLRSEVTVILLFLGLLIVGTLASLAFENRWADVVSYHLGGLGVVGLLASQAAHMARKKGRDPNTAFILGTLLPYVLGSLVVVLVFYRSGFVYCGGGVVLLSAMIVAIVYSCLGKRPTAWVPGP